MCCFVHVLQKRRQMSSMASMQVFDSDDFPPDAEFGCFQMVKGPGDTDFADQALLRLDVGELKSTCAVPHVLSGCCCIHHVTFQLLFGRYELHHLNKQSCECCI